MGAVLKRVVVHVALVVGESVGQVSSQMLTNLRLIDDTLNTLNSVSAHLP
ncbi:MAG: tRNA sulfurtransferase [Sodalis sp.]|nr:MAG: tRNA sulfurtransferase [Sodalis sp.]